MNRAIASVLSAFLFSGLPVESFAQFSDNWSNDGDQLYSGIEGYWAGYTSCRDGVEIYAFFLEVSRSDNGFQAVGKSFGGTRSYDRSYDLIETSSQQYVVVPAIDAGTVNDVSIEGDLLSGTSRTADCIIKMRKTEKIPY